MDDINFDPTSQVLRQVKEFTYVDGLYVPEGVAVPKTPGNYYDCAKDGDIDSELRALELRQAELDFMREVEPQPQWLDLGSTSSAEAAQTAAEKQPSKIAVTLGRVATKVVHRVFMPMVSAKEAIGRLDWQTPHIETDAVKERIITPKKTVESVASVVDKVKASNQRSLAAALLAGGIVVTTLAGSFIDRDSDASKKASNNSTLEVQVISPELLNQQVEKIKTIEEPAPGPNLPKSIKELLPDIEKYLQYLKTPEMKREFQEKRQPEIFLNKRIIGSLIYCLSSGNKDAVSQDGQRLGLWQMTRADIDEYFGKKGITDPFNKDTNMLAGIVDFHLRTTQVLKTGLYSPESPTYIEDVMRAAITGKHTANSVGLDPDPTLAAGLADRVMARYYAWDK